VMESGSEPAEMYKILINGCTLMVRSWPSPAGIQDNQITEETKKGVQNGEKIFSSCGMITNVALQNSFSVKLLKRTVAGPGLILKPRGSLISHLWKNH